MKQGEETKRLFLGAEMRAPWPELTPKGRILDASMRHLTLAFLGDIEIQKISELPALFLPIPFKVGLVGRSRELLFLPKEHPRTVSYAIDWLSYEEDLLHFQKKVYANLVAKKLAKEKGSFLSHVTVARSPFDRSEWESHYCAIPCVLAGFHLYESLGNLHYQPLWSYPLLPPFEELEHTADIAFCVRAEKKWQIHLHAQIALAFKFPSLLPFIFLDSLEEDFHAMIVALNKIVSRADQAVGCPFKAVSFHGMVAQNKEGIFQWNMIVDV